MAIKDEDGKFNTALLDYVQRGSVEVLQSFLQKDNSDLRDSGGKTLLHYAAKSNNVSMTQHFINNNHDIDVADNHGNSPLMLAVVNGSYDSAIMLMEAGANIYWRSGDTANILSNKPNFGAGCWMSNEYQKFVKAILIQLQKDCCDDEYLLLKRLRDVGCSILQVISLGDADVTKLMLENGYSVDEREFQTNETALHRAVFFGDVKNVKVLLDFGASIDVLNENEIPPVYKLYDMLLTDSQKDEKQRVEILKIFIEHGALSIRISDDHMAPLEFILRYGTLGAVNTLMQYDVDYNSFDVLNCLVSNANDDALEVLRGKSFDVNAHDADGFSLLSNATCMCSLTKVQFLLEHGADPNVVDVDDGQTPLTDAFSEIGSDLPENLLAIVRLLLQYGADVQYVITDYNQEQKTVFDLENSSGEVMESVIAHLALIESCGVTISDRIRAKINSRDTYERHFEVCKEQIEEMKNTTVNESVTLYKLLTESHLKISKYARDQAFAHKFEEAMKNKSYLDPYYSISLHNRVGKAIYEAKLKDDAIVVMNKIFPCRLRNCKDIFEKILDYLACDDLKNICNVNDLKNPNLPI